ncbi:MAG: D-3-phosphoglycerate dehydrogenase [Devosia sp.]|nr:D-3-phosphoglycerate dehydrogenase [Devosia sp.]
MIAPAPRQRILVVSDSLHELDDAVALLTGCGHEVTYIRALTPFAAIDVATLGTADGIVMGRVMGIDATALALATNARVIALHTSGSDNVDLAAASARGIVVTNVKGVNAEQCAEFSIGLMLAVTRQIRTGDIAIRKGEWAGRTQSSMDLIGATLGVIGLGLIGKAAVRRAVAFGMRIVCYTRTPDLAFGEQYGIEYVSLDAALAQADVVSLYASLTPDTRHMIGARELGLMRPSAYLINIARGELVDEAALFDALVNRRIAGAGLDVFETEPLTESPFFALDNVVLTPHQAGLTHSGKSGAAIRAARNCIDVLEGRLPSDAINPQAFAQRSAT